MADLDAYLESILSVHPDALDWTRQEIAALTT